MPAGFGKDIFVAGITLTPFAIGLILGGIMASTLINKTGAKPMTIAGTIVAAAGFLLEATIPSYTLLWVYSIVCGIGVVMILGTLFNFVIFSVDPKEMGMATGMQATFNNVVVKVVRIAAATGEPILEPTLLKVACIPVAMPISLGSTET